MRRSEVIVPPSREYIPNNCLFPAKFPAANSTDSLESSGEIAMATSEREVSTLNGENVEEISDHAEGVDGELMQEESQSHTLMVFPASAEIPARFPAVEIQGNEKLLALPTETGESHVLVGTAKMETKMLFEDGFPEEE